MTLTDLSENNIQADQDIAAASKDTPDIGVDANLATSPEVLREKEHNNRRSLLQSSESMNDMNIIAFIFMLLLGEQGKEQGNGHSSLNETSTNLISAALGLDAGVLNKTINEVRSGETSALKATQSIYFSIDTKTADFEAANDAVKEFHNLGNLPPADDANFLKAVDVVLKLEGGWNPNEPDGAVANFGINSKANPDIDVRNLTQNAAVQLYKDRYWDKIDGIDELDQRTALVAFDLAVNSGPGRANQFLKESGGNLEKLMEMRFEYYDKLIEGNPAKFAEYESGWDDRLERLSAAVEQIPSQNQLVFNSGGVIEQDLQQPFPLPFDGFGTDLVALYAQNDSDNSQQCDISGNENSMPLIFPIAKI